MVNFSDVLNKTKTEMKSFISINSFEQLIKCATDKKEVELKYDLVRNVNLVNFLNFR